MIRDERKRTVQAGNDLLAPRLREWDERIVRDPWDRFLEELLARVSEGCTLPADRRRGIGPELLERVVVHAADQGRPWASGMVFEDDPASVAWAERRGFEEYDRQVVLSRVLASAEAEAVPPAGIELVELNESRYEETYVVWVEGYPDMPLSVPIPPPSYEEWLDEEISGPVTLVALDGGRVVGAAALLESANGIAEHGLTATLRSHWGRGVATALKQALVHRAWANGYRELTTGTQDGNAAMQAINISSGTGRCRP